MNRRHSLLQACGFVAAGLLAMLLALPAAADYQVRGRFLYRDRPFGLGGFTGVDVDKPIRFADVEVIDAANTVLGLTSTDATGNFVLDVVDSQTRDIRVRVLCRGTAAAVRLQVLRTTDSALFAVLSPTFSGHLPTQNIDFTASPVVAVQGSGGDPFNIWETGIDAYDFIAARTGSRPTRLLTCYWAVNSSDGTYYRVVDASIHLVGLANDSDGFDDTVILHEMGHYTEANFADSDNPGGAHSLNGLYDLRLTWSEGQATFFNNMVRNFGGVARPEIYVDTSGQPGPGGAFLAFEVETPSLGVLGANNEVSVNAALWDIVDDAATADASPGVDDDALQIPNAVDRFWQTFTIYIRIATSISMEDFWDGWFALGHDSAAGMRSTFAARGIEYFDDLFEDDDSPAQARTFAPDGLLEHHTIYGIGDEDWVKLLILGGGPYTFETRNMLSACDTRLDLYASDGTTLLASNDDRASGDPSSRILYTPPVTSLVYLRCKRKTDPHTYGSYNLVVQGPVVAVAVSDVSLEREAGEAVLRWRARADAAFSHFDVERAADASGWWVRRNTEPLVPAAGEPVMVFRDAEVQGRERWSYRLVGREQDGTQQVFGPYVLEAAPVARLALAAPRPNPFNPTANFDFELPAAGRATLQIYAPNGRRVRALLENALLPAGRHTLRWDGRDDAGRGLASGVYVVRLETPAGSRAQRAVLVR